MKLVVPYIRDLLPVDARIVRLAESLGISCERLALANVAEHPVCLGEMVSDPCLCFLVNPRVMKEWIGLDRIPPDLVALLLSRFTHLLVHGLRVDTFDTAMVAALSRGRLQSVDALDRESHDYVIANDFQRVCEAFSGLSFGPANPANDHVFSINTSDGAVRQLISIGGRPFMAAVTIESAEVIFVASQDVVDLNAEVGDAPLAEYFSRFVPHAMALRYAAGDECWRPCEHHASVIVDDPLLRKNYGFLNFETLLRLTKDHNFHTTIAFIPHNFRRSSPPITRMFRDNATRLAICFHGNDHTGAEFASTDPALLHTLLGVAEHRMNLHHQMTGLHCDRVMVFPQGNFSIEAMKVLKSHNFYAGVNTVPHPTEQPVRLTIGELAQPAVLRYGGFPLFIRKPILQTQDHDIAFDLFFGRPVLIVEHHEVFQHAELLAGMASRINRVAPGIQWSNLANAVSSSVLSRRDPDGTYHVRAYSHTARVANDSGCAKRFSIEWARSSDGSPIEEVLMDGTPCRGFEVDGARVRLSVELAPSSSHTFSLVHRNVGVATRSLGVRWNAHAFLRRRLSELRDNYLSKNRELLRVAKALQRYLLK